MNKYCSKRGFTLIELLVVISVILIASSIIFIGGNGGAGAALSSSTRIVSGIAKGARGQAILKSARTRLIIHNDIDSEEGKYRRFVGLVYEDSESPNTWIAATQGTYLPEGIYFDPDLSSNHGWPSNSTMRLEYPRNAAKSEGTGDNYYYFEFNGNGTVASSPRDFVNAWLVLRAGTLKPSGGTLVLQVEEEQESLVSALIFRRAGSTTVVTEPSDIL